MAGKEIYLGIDIGGTYIKFATVYGSGRVGARGIIPTLPRAGLRSAFHRVRSALPFLLHAKEELRAVGIGCAGLVDAKRGVLVASPNLRPWEGSRLRATARNVFKLPVVVDNDAAAAAYGEYVRGSGKGCECFICITLGTGVGGGIVIGGELLRGANNFTAEIGHITISENGPKCTCGNRGCLEAFVGASALVGRAREEMRSRRGRILGKKSWARREVLSPRVLARAAAEGDGIARMVFAEAGARLGCAAATLANIFNPEVIAVTGGVAGAFEFMEGSLRRELEKRAFAATANVKVTRALLGKDASMIGAALLAAAG